MKENTVSNNFDRLLKYLLYLFVFLLPWQVRWIVCDPRINPEFSGGVWEYGRISLYGFDVVFVVILALCLINLFKAKAIKAEGKRKQEKSREKGSRWLGGRWQALNLFTFLLFCFYVFMSVIWADHKPLSFYWSLRILQGVILVWLISKISFSKVKLASAFIASMTLSAALGIYQFLTQSSFANKWLGLAYHSAGFLGDSVVETATGRWLRVYGSFPHPNIAAGFILVAIIVCFYLLNVLVNKYQEIKKLRILKLLLVISCLLLTIALFFTFSRAAWLAFLVLSILYLVLCIKRRLEIKKPVLNFSEDWKLLFFSLFLVSCFLLIVYWPLAQTRLQGAERLEVKSNIQRIAGYQESFKMIKNHQLVGVGIGNYTYELQKMRPNLPAWAYQPVHNVYLLVMSELGIIGFVIFILIFSTTLLRVNKDRKKERGAGKGGSNCQLPNIFIFLFIFFFFFDHFWWTLPSALLLWWLGLGLILANF